jgi:hypothetical protein
MRILGLPIELWVFLAIGLLSFIQWLVKKAQAQQELQKARRMQQQREQEILRTGRDPVAERAAQIKAEQDRLRKMEAQSVEASEGEGEGEARPQTQPQTIERQLWPGGPVVVITQQGPTLRPSTTSSVPSAPAPASNSPAGANAERERQRRIARERKLAAKRQAAERARQSLQPSENPFEDANRRRAAALSQQQARFATETAELVEEEQATARRAVAAQQSAQLAAKRARDEAAINAPREVAFVKPTAAWQWRRAFVTAEVLNAPVTLRRNHFEELGGSGR